MTGKKYRNWAESIGPWIHKFITSLLQRFVIEEQAYQSCMGILRMADKYSEEALEEACRKACELGIDGYQQIKKILTRIKQEQDQKQLNTHENIRGASYYTKG